MNIILLGYGQMGKAIEELAEVAGHTIQLKIDIDNKEELTSEAVQGADMAFEFSTPDTVLYNISFCFDNKIPVVVGTTGWQEQLEAAKQECIDKGQTMFHASNFSLGVYIFSEINKRLAELMDKQEAYDISMEETHHKAKLDAPSGTAIKLAEDIIERVERKEGWVNAGETAPEKINISSHREDNIPGTHAVHYQSTVDDIDIRHTAHSRQGFAEGAVRAAEWIQGKTGVFTMSDLFE